MNTPSHKPPPSPLKLAIGTGATGHGVQHWWWQRLTAIALVPLSLWFLFFIAGLVGAPYAGVQAAIASPLSALLLIALGVSLFWHGALGLQVIVEDYVHTPWLAVSLQVALKFGAFLAALAMVLAVLAIWLGQPATV